MPLTKPKTLNIRIDNNIYIFFFQSEWTTMILFPMFVFQSLSKLLKLPNFSETNCGNKLTTSYKKKKQKQPLGFKIGLLPHFFH